MCYHARHIARRGFVIQARDFDVLKTMKCKTWFIVAPRLAGEKVNVGCLRSTQVAGVNGAVRIEPLRVTHHDLLSVAAFRFQTSPANHILAKVEDIHARFRFGHGFCGHFFNAAN